jgi:transcriptional regulator with PAS, ATPase and Fis domain
MNYPFIAVNCAALPEELLESELFGHERGSFTGAIRKKEGKVELANGGTLFLDEIGELKLDMQTKLLRILQEHLFERVGGTETLSADIRIVAATNKDLLKQVKKGLFRQDLFYRLNVVSLTIPPLRQRKEDVIYIANQFIEKYCLENAKKQPELTPAARKILLDYCWPGNVRELENVLERAMVLWSGDKIEAEDLFLGSSAYKDSEVELGLPFQELLKNYKRKIIIEALRESGGNQTKAAKQLSIKQPYLSKMIKDLGLKKTEILL